MRRHLALLLLSGLAWAQPTPTDRLIHSAWLGQLSELKQLLTSGQNPNTKNKQGQTPLEKAASSGQLEAVKMLLAFGADPNLYGHSLHSPLAAACWDGQTQIAKLLLEAGANPSPPDPFSPIYAAVLSRKLDTLELLLHWKANPNPAAPDHDPATVWAAHNFPEGLRALLKAGANPHRADSQGFTPLSRAASSGNLQSLEVLLDLGLDPDGHSPLPIEISARQGHRKVFNHLLPLTRFPDSALVAAAQAGWVQEAKTLSSKASPSAQVEALIAAAGCELGDEAALELCQMLQTKPVPNSQALLSAASKGHLQTANLLLQRGASLETVDSKGRTPLMLACRAASLELVKELLQRGAQAEVLDHQGHSALHLLDEVIASKNLEVARLQASRAYQPKLPQLQEEVEQYQRTRLELSKLFESYRPSKRPS